MAPQADMHMTDDEQVTASRILADFMVKGNDFFKAMGDFMEGPNALPREHPVVQAAADLAAIQLRACAFIDNYGLRRNLDDTSN